MKKDRVLTAGILSFILALAFLAWVLLHPAPAPRAVESPETPTALAVTDAAEPGLEVPPAPADSTDSSEPSSLLADLTEDMSASPVEVFEQGPGPDLPPPSPEVEALLAAVAEALGWDTVNSMKCHQTIVAEGLFTIEIDTAFQRPGSIANFIEVVIGQEKQNIYMVTDGVLADVGQLGEDGKRQSFGLMEYNSFNSGLSPLLDDKLLNPALYQTIETVSVDPADHLFTKPDGSPYESSEFTLLKGSIGGTETFLYIDPSTMRPVAFRAGVPDQPDFGLDIGGVEYQEVSKGVFYPVKSTAHARGRDIRVGPMSVPEIIFNIETPADKIEINREIDPSAFRFSVGQ